MNLNIYNEIICKGILHIELYSVKCTHIDNKWNDSFQLTRLVENVYIQMSLKKSICSIYTIIYTNNLLNKHYVHIPKTVSFSLVQGKVKCILINFNINI